MNMKTPGNLRKTLKLIIILFTVATGLTSCIKDSTDDNSQPAYIAAINASVTAGQDFYVDNVKINSSTLGYGQSLTYQAYTPGIHQVSFTAAGTTTGNASATISASSAGFYSVFYTDDKSIVIVPDDRTAPLSTTQSRVRFVNLATSNIMFDVGFATGTKRIVSGLPYKTASSFLDIDAGTTFALYQAGGTTPVLNIPATIAGGHIYTIFIAGSTPTTLNYQLITQD